MPTAARSAVVALATIFLVLILVLAFMAVALLDAREGGDSAAICGPPASDATPTVGLDVEQTGNVVTIVAVGAQVGAPPRAAVIAVATAMQESSLRNLPGGDRDSAGLFQQRPSQGWGSLAEITDPIAAATSFYRALLDIPDWDQLPLTAAAQQVQRSAFPEAYAKWEQLANSAVGAALGVVCGPPGGPNIDAGASAVIRAAAPRWPTAFIGAVRRGTGPAQATSLP